MNNKFIYFDNAATTSIYKEVIQEMNFVMNQTIGNPSANHSLGQDSKSLIEHSRKKIAKILNVFPQEIIFTSCATESNNLIIRSAVETFDIKRIITTKLEHKSVFETCLDLQKKYDDLEIIYLSNNNHGEINNIELENYLINSNKKTLVSLMHANNEIGNLINIIEIGNLCKQNNAFFHSDIVQTIAHLPINLGEIPVDFASVSAHKFHGPKGIGFAFIKKNVKIKSQISGGGQERNFRSGTENIYGIAGMCKALEISINNLEEHKNKILELKKYAIQEITKKLPKVKFSGNSADLDKSLFTILHILLPVKNELIGFLLDMKGICLSQGSACSSGAAKFSNVMKSILSEDEQMKITPLRISFSYENTFKEIDYLIDSLIEILNKKS